MLWGGRNTENKYHWCVWVCLHGVDHTGFVPTYGACALLVYTAQVQFLGFSTKPQTRLGLCFVLFPGPRSLGDQVFGENTIPGVRCILSLPWSQLLSFLGALQEHHLRCAVCLLWWADIRL